MIDELACNINVVDLLHDSDLDRITEATIHDINRTKKYNETLNVLQEQL
jgi:hypothetical protein